jgi:hypothetical protein
MSLIDELAREFPFQVRSKGKQYYLDDAVEINSADAGVIEAKVQGTNLYRVECRWHDRKSYSFSCSCPDHAEQDQLCKHLWATLLEADHQGMLDLAARRLGGDLPKFGFIGRSTGNGNGHANGNGHSSSTATADDNGSSKAKPARVSMWRAKLSRLQQAASVPDTDVHHHDHNNWPADRRMVYAIDVESTRNGFGGIVIELYTQKKSRSGKWSDPRRYSVQPEQWLKNPDEADARIAQFILGSDTFHTSVQNRRIELAKWAHNTTLKEIVQSGRCFVLDEGQLSTTPLAWDDASPFEFVLELQSDANSRGHRLVPMLRRDETLRPLSEALSMTAFGWAVFPDRVARFQHHGAWSTLVSMREQGEILVPAGEELDLLGELLKLPRIPPVSVPPSMGLTEVKGQPKPVAVVRRNTRDRSGPPRLTVELMFDYDGFRLNSAEPRSTHLILEQKKIVHRDRQFEKKQRASLRRAGCREDFDPNTGQSSHFLWPEQLPGAVIEWMAIGWAVEADGSLYRAATGIDAKLASGIDWFDLNVTINFGNLEAKLPKLLEALSRGEKFVKLDDGTLGVVPDEWLAKYAMLAGVGKSQEDGTLRFGKSQTAFLDALVAQLPATRVDEVFQNARNQLAGFEGVEPVEPPQSFVGELRPYQKQGLGWLGFLQQFQFGGCLADDMGLGKTIQVLALLESRRQAGKGTTLVVVPRSLVFNWRQEAEKFCPGMRVLDHSGIARSRDLQSFVNYDIVLTTYGTLRRDIAELKDFQFDYVVLDESQAIKNSATASAKAVRLLRSAHRLAMSGTPIENHLGELWSLFEFLNPGMLGSASLFKALSTMGTAPKDQQPPTDEMKAKQAESRRLIGQALRPFILRRTKKQVASDLPDRVEQTIHCELSEQQRKLYDELRDHYRQNVLSQVDLLGVGKNQMQILEALLRLRQAACHPGLIDQKYASEPSAKLDVLVEQLSQIMEEDHKALVFSQFTSFLGLLKTRLDALGIRYEYLDGKTRDRQERVNQFQNDPTCKLFLVSLKAGGVGLNLTAAEYVFLLDPWWNPAVEAQAIDRAHRIGQTRKVFAYRLIAQNTVEEKVLQLQQSKRNLADAIINEDNSMLSNLSADDLKLLLS